MILQSLENELVQYTSIVFLQDQDADEPIKIFEQDGSGACLEFLKQWDYGDSAEVSLTAPWGAYDFLFQIDEYVVNYNFGLPYIGLTRVKILDPNKLMDDVVNHLKPNELGDAIYQATNGYQDIWEALREQLQPEINAAALEA